jgi:hypothetical protein
MVETRNRPTDRILVGKSFGKRPLGRPRKRRYCIGINTWHMRHAWDIVALKMAYEYFFEKEQNLIFNLNI